MNMVSYYKSLTPDNQIAGGLGQGGGGYWQEDVGIRLQEEIAKVLGAELSLSSRPHGRDSYDRKDYTPLPIEGVDIAYCQLFEVPNKRPAKWIYSIISDYLHMEEVLEDFLCRAKPNLIISFQYPLVPPSGKSNLVAQCEAHGCKVVFLPWFNATDVPVYNPTKDVVAMCTGKIGGTYPMRDKIYNFLAGLGRDDVLLSGNPHGSTFKLNDDEYRDALSRCRYYVTGGIYDIQIPPKYYEVCNYGAALVSPELPMMAEAGFIDGGTYIKINNVEEIPAILESDRWMEIGRQGQNMVHGNHSLKARAMDIAELYEEHVHNDRTR
jgi:hypothetical protein